MDIVIVGAGGHGKVVLDILRATGKHRVVGFLDADPSLTGTRVGDLPVLGNIHQIARLRQQKVKGAVVAIGDNHVRLRYAAHLRQEGLELVSAIHPSAIIAPSASVGTNVVIAAGAVICAEARLGDSVILNTNAVVEHECEVADGAHVCPTAALGGRVSVGRGAFLGLGAKLIPCISIGHGATVGAGAVVIRDIPDGATAVGVPARVIKLAPPAANAA